MKKIIRTILYAVVFAVLAVSCQEENNEVEPIANTKENIEISINGLMGEYTQVDVTKAELVNNVRVSWKGGETVFVFDGAEYIGSLVASLDGTEDRYALLSTDTDHTVKAPATGTTKLTLVYSPLLTEVPVVSDGAISISLANQNGTKPPFVAYATLDYNNEETITDALVPFKFATSVIKVNCTGLKANTAIDKATLSNVNTACTLALSGTAAPTVTGDVNGIITKTGDAYFAADKVNSEGVAVFQIATPVLETATKARVLTVEQGSNYYKYKNFSKKSLPVATSVNTVCQTVDIPAGVLPGEFSISNGKQVYFSKGNLYYDGSKFDFESEQFACPVNGEWDPCHVCHFYWCESAESAVAEEYGVSGSEDDVFFTNSPDFQVEGAPKGAYKSLSPEEWQYLIEDRSTSTIGGVANARFAKATIQLDGDINVPGLILFPDSCVLPSDIVPNRINVETIGFDANTYTEEGWGKLESAGCVFLPLAGCRSYDKVSDVGETGYYMSSTVYDATEAHRLYIIYEIVDSHYFTMRSEACSVRLVTDVK